MSEINKSILIICNPKLGLSSMYVRGVAFEEEFFKNSWNYKYVSISKGGVNIKGNDIPVLSNAEIVKLARSYKYVYLLKVNDINLIKELKASTDAIIIFDFIDALWRPLFQLRGWKDINKILMCCDRIFCENSFIANYALTYNQNVNIIPFYVPIEKFINTKKNNQRTAEDKITIGWVGSESTANALKNIKKPLKNICKRYPNVEVMILGTSMKRAKKILRNIPLRALSKYDEDIMIKEVSSFDIGIFPPPGDLMDYALRGANKGMIYMGAGVPTIFQRAGDCLNFIEDGINGMLAGSQREWEEKLERLIQSKQLREEIGSAGFKTISDKHTRRNVFCELEKAFLNQSESAAFTKSIEYSQLDRFKFFISGWLDVLDKAASLGLKGIIDKLRK